MVLSRNILSSSPPPDPRLLLLPTIIFTPVPNSPIVSSPKFSNFHITVANKHHNVRFQSKAPHWQLHREILDAPIQNGPCLGFRCCNDAIHPSSALLPRTATPDARTTTRVFLFRTLLRPKATRANFSAPPTLWMGMRAWSLSLLCQNVASRGMLQCAMPAVLDGEVTLASAWGASMCVL